MKNPIIKLLVAITIGTASLAPSFAADEESTPPRRPNIVFILADDKYAEAG